MPFLVNCPACARKLKVPDAVRGKKVKCPNCAAIIQTPLEEPILATPDPEGERAVKADPPRGRSPAWDFAEAADIDLNETHTENVPDAAYANRILGHWKETFPEVKSAYQPSGVLPPAALMLMSLGSVLGVPGGLLANGLVAGLTVLVLALVGLLTGLVMAFCGVVFCIVVVVVGVIVLAGYVLAFAAHGFVSAFMYHRDGAGWARTAMPRRRRCYRWPRRERGSPSWSRSWPSAGPG